MCSKKPNIYYLSGGREPIKSMRTPIEGNIGIDQDMTGENTAGAALLDTFGSLLTSTAEIVGDAGNAIADEIAKNIEIPTYDEKQSEIMKDINDARNFAEKFASDQQMQAAVKSLVETYIEAAEELGEITEPAREQIMNEVFEAISETSEEAAVGAVNTGMNVAEAALGEIPVVGGVIDLAFAAARAVNNVIKPLSTALEKGSEVAGQAITTADKAKEVFDSKKGQFQKNIAAVQQAYNNPMTAAIKNPGLALKAGNFALKNPNVTTSLLGRGGKKKRKKKKGPRKTKKKKNNRKRKTKRKKAKRTINRIKRTIKRFTKKHRK